MDRVFRGASHRGAGYTTLGHPLAGFFFLLACICLPARSPGAEIRRVSPSLPEPGLRFAIADLDGDQRPDLATIQAGQTSSAFTNDYWVQLRLSAREPRSFRLVAPQGGLFIEARDVNGDHALDLVLSTAWQREPVAILLNDGHGNFSRAAPMDYPKAFVQSSQSWGTTSTQQDCPVASPPQSRSDLQANRKTLSVTDLCSAFSTHPNPLLISGGHSFPYAGRAPPAAARR